MPRAQSSLPFIDRYITVWLGQTCMLLSNKESWIEISGVLSLGKIKLLRDVNDGNLSYSQPAEGAETAEAPTAAATEPTATAACLVINIFE
uniref:Uncharacterized protein n=1 Tax=Vespula pensylvanica TaxID=30213 RepID=A0A834P337_VESPE|nr:hypothetical protein H0235_006624 [Vespula pensylvanica]